MPSLDDLNEEILRTRERLHKLENSLYGLRLHLASLSDNQKRTSDLLDSVAYTVQQMSSADEIREAIADELHKRGPVLPLREAWKIAAGGVGFAAVFLGVVEALHTLLG